MSQGMLESGELGMYSLGKGREDRAAFHGSTKSLTWFDLQLLQDLQCLLQKLSKMGD